MPSSREELENLWRRRLEQAEEVHQRALSEVERIRGARDTGALTGQEGDAALRRAIREERRARVRFIRTLRIFSDLVVRHKPPPDDHKLAG